MLPNRFASMSIRFRPDGTAGYDRAGIKYREHEIARDLLKAYGIFADVILGGDYDPTVNLE
jgi:hypothetical protein